MCDDETQFIAPTIVQQLIQLYVSALSTNLRLYDFQVNLEPKGRLHVRIDLKTTSNGNEITLFIIIFSVELSYTPSTIIFNQRNFLQFISFTLK